VTHVSEKAKALAQATTSLQQQTEHEIDQSLQKVSDITARKNAAMQKLDQVHADLTTGTEAIEETVKNLTNQ
jgi:hypothetical protein